VSRGWLPTGSKQDFPDINPVPEGKLTSIVGRIVATEPELDRSAPEGQIASINPKLATRILNIDNAVTNGYLRLASESPEMSAKLQSMPAPSINEGNNLSYAAQWIIFAIMAIWALVWRVRRDTLLAKGALPAKKRRSRSDLDKDAEDEIMRAK
jgi:cytochrome oxidase assembly protein ShyY1